MWGRVGGGGLAVGTILAFVFGCLPGYAAGSSIGEISRSQRSDDWSVASVAGTASRLNGCIKGPKPEKPETEPGEEPPPPLQPKTPPWECGWIAFATVGPGSSSGDCSSAGRRWNLPAEGVQLIWTSEELVGAGSAAFDLDGVTLEYGSSAPLLCLSAVESVPEGIACANDEGEVLVECPPYAIAHRTEQLDAAILEPPPSDFTLPPDFGTFSSGTALEVFKPKPSGCRAKHRHSKKKAKIGVSQRGKAGHGKHCRVA